MKLKIPVLLAVFVLLSSCLHSGGGSTAEYIRSRPEKQLKNYTFDPDTPIVSRIQETPDSILDNLKAWDDVDYYTSYTPTEAEGSLIEEYIGFLPPLHREIMQEKLIAIYFVKDLIGSGIADYVLDEENNLYNILILNPASLTASLSEWMTYREQSCFISDTDDLSVTVDCGSEYTGFLYALLHESTHIVDYQYRITPYTESHLPAVLNEGAPKSTDFTKGIWDGYSEPSKPYRKDFRGDVTFYGLGNGPRLPLSDAPAVYRDLQETPFASLYGSMSWAEDYAELVTWHYMTEVLNQPYRILLNQGGEEIFRYSPMASDLVRLRLETISGLY